MPGLVIRARHLSPMARALSPLASPNEANGMFRRITARSNSCCTWVISRSNPLPAVPKPKLPMVGISGTGWGLSCWGTSRPVLNTLGLFSSRVGSGPM